MNSLRSDQKEEGNGSARAPETELVWRTRNGDVEAFEELLNRH